MKRPKNWIRIEMNAARRIWGSLGKERMKELKSVVLQHKLSILQGDVLLLDNRWYITSSGLLRCARRHRCSGIETFLESSFSDPSVSRWVFRAVVYGSNRSKAFVGFGDADPASVNSLVRGAELRIAETRAVSRAIRRAYAIPICSIEELGAFSTAPNPSAKCSSLEE